jgi:wyosine [tRNA(Phe)-imidazoG37] synthetase (radical SAM superfamily)
MLQLFTQHSRSWRDNRYVYPVISRRSKGLSIGVNLNPDKVCNFDCVYCCVDRTVPPEVRDVDMTILREELDHLIGLAASGEIFRGPPFDETPAELQRFNDVAFSGDGEPTAFPGFDAACRLAAELLDRRSLPGPKIVVITNATLLHRPPVQEALGFLDQHNGEIWTKLDAGTEAYYRQIERTTIPLQRVLDNIALCGQRRSIVIQSLFMNLHGQPPDDVEIDGYVDRLRELLARGTRVKLVQVYTVARRTTEDWVTPLPPAALDDIAARAASAGVPVETYYGPS